MGINPQEVKWYLNDYKENGGMKTKEFIRWLVAQGVKVEEGSKHTKLYYGGKRSTMSRQKEIPDLHAENIKKQLGLK